jgi:mono/diheme cytochrome c family protein
MPPHDDLELSGLFTCDVDVSALTARLRESGVPAERIHVLSPVPLSGRASDRIGRMPFYGITIGAGIVGIGVGVFFAAGTAMMYPLMTGGKPIVAAPVVGIISYETMMLLAIVVTFIAMMLRIKTANASVHRRDMRIDEGRIALVVRVPDFPQSAGAVRDAMEQAGALDLQMSVVPSGGELRAPVGQAAALLIPLVIAGVVPACSQDMQEQPSYQAQEAPRRHSPAGSVPRESRRLLPLRTENAKKAGDIGARLFQINCVHCHGPEGEGNGPVAAFLKERPANLRADEVRGKSEEAIYRIVTDGKDMMPSFKGELSAEERLDIARYVRSLTRPSGAHRGSEGR